MYKAELEKERLRQLGGVPGQGEEVSSSGAGQEASAAAAATLLPRSPVDWQGHHRVDSGRLPTVAYIPNFIDEAEAAHLAAAARADESKWVALNKRRLQNLGGVPVASQAGMMPEPLPAFVESLIDALVQSGIFPSDKRPNHCLLNEYQPGQGIMPHKDGPLYFERVAILSLGGTAALDFWPELQAVNSKTPPVISVLTQPQSLLVFDQNAYTDVFHGIAEREHDTVIEGVTANAACFDQSSVSHPRGIRLSLTIRHVLKVAQGTTLNTPAQMEEARRVNNAFLRSVND